MNGSRKPDGKSRLPEPALRQDALAAQARRQQYGQTKAPAVVVPEARARSASEPKPMTGSQRRAVRREAATTIQNAFRGFAARKALRESMKGNTPAKLMELVGQSYMKDGLVKRVTKASGPIDRDAGRLAGDWSGGVDTQKKHINAQGGPDQIGTTHHTVSDHFLGFVHAGVKRLEAGSSADKSAAQRFRTQVASDSLYGGDASQHEKALFQVRQNLTYGPGSDFIKGDPGVGFDATFTRPAAPGKMPDWDARSTRIRPVHNLGLLLKSGKFELTGKGADHMTGQLASARGDHDTALGAKTYDVVAKSTGKGGVPITTTSQRAQTIPVHGVNSGHFDSVPITRNSGVTVSGFQKKKWT